ncbi:hypothetical protein GGI05_005522 [Coemansia sp. RSA 2603]|nr:hypothetical protein GGI05_005522 [Coemansia sp. RSA 2603]
MHVHAGYHPAQPAPLRNERRASGTTFPADTSALSGHRRASAVILPAHDWYPPHTAPPTQQYSAKYYAGLPSIVYADEGLPGSYAHRRRGSIGGSSAADSARSSTTVSPASPAESHACYAEPPLFASPQRRHIRSHYYADPPAAASLHRNNTTKTVAHNDLAVGRRLSPSRSANFAAQSAFNTKYSGLLPPMPEGSALDVSPNTEKVCSHELASVRRSAASMATAVSADPLKGLDDAVDLASVVVAVGKQHAYLPPRSTTLTITN